MYAWTKTISSWEAVQLRKPGSGPASHPLRPIRVMTDAVFRSRSLGSGSCT